MLVAVHEIQGIEEPSLQIDEETYAYERPHYTIEARVSAATKEKLERHWDSQSALSYNDGILTDTVQIESFDYEHDIGYDEHIIGFSLRGSNL